MCMYISVLFAGRLESVRTRYPWIGWTGCGEPLIEMQRSVVYGRLFAAQRTVSKGYCAQPTAA